MPLFLKGSNIFWALLKSSFCSCCDKLSKNLLWKCEPSLHYSQARTSLPAWHLFWGAPSLWLALAKPSFFHENIHSMKETLSHHLSPATLCREGPQTKQTMTPSRCAIMVKLQYHSIMAHKCNAMALCPFRHVQRSMKLQLNTLYMTKSIQGKETHSWAALK